MKGPVTHIARENRKGVYMIMQMDEIRGLAYKVRSIKTLLSSGNADSITLCMTAYKSKRLSSLLTDFAEHCSDEKQKNTLHFLAKRVHEYHKSMTSKVSPFETITGQPL